MAKKTLPSLFFLAKLNLKQIGEQNDSRIVRENAPPEVFENLGTGTVNRHFCAFRTICHANFVFLSLIRLVLYQISCTFLTFSIYAWLRHKNYC